MGRYQDALTWARGRHDKRVPYVDDETSVKAIARSAALAVSHHEGNPIRRAYLAQTISDAETMLAAHELTYPAEHVDDVCATIEAESPIGDLDLLTLTGSLAHWVGNYNTSIADEDLEEIIGTTLILLAHELNGDHTGTHARNRRQGLARTREQDEGALRPHPGEKNPPNAHREKNEE